MPTTNEGLDQVEAVVSSDNSTNNAASSAGSVSADPAPRRRRGGPVSYTHLRAHET